MGGRCATRTRLMTTDPVRDYKVTAFSLNVRGAARIDAAVVGHLHKDEVARVSGTSRDKYWLKVSTDSVQGWASHKFLAKVPLSGSRRRRPTWCNSHTESDQRGRGEQRDPHRAQSTLTPCSPRFLCPRRETCEPKKGVKVSATTA